MPTDGDATGQVPTASSPDSNGQVPPASQVSTNNADNSDSAPSEQDMTPAEYRDALKRANAQAAKYRVDSKRLAELEKAEQERRDANLSETERLQKQYADLQTKASEDLANFQARLVRAETRGLAEKLGIKQELAQLLVTSKYAEIAFNDDGDPTNVAELLATAMEAMGLAAASNGQQPSPSMPMQPAVPAVSATNPSRASQTLGPNSRFGRNDIPKLNDPGIWTHGRGRSGN